MTFSTLTSSFNCQVQPTWRLNVKLVTKKVLKSHLNEAADCPLVTPKIWTLCLVRLLVVFPPQSTCCQREIRSSTCYYFCQRQNRKKKKKVRIRRNIFRGERRKGEWKRKWRFTYMFILSWTLRHSLGVNLGNTDGTKSGFDGSIDTFPVVGFHDLSLAGCQEHSKCNNTVTVAGFQWPLVQAQHGVKSELPRHVLVCLHVKLSMLQANC